MERTYLELSPRRAYKTTRLMNAVINHILTGGFAFVMRGPDGTSGHLCEQINKEMGRYSIHYDSVPEGTYYVETFKGRVIPIYSKKELSWSGIPDRLRGLRIDNPRFFCDNAELCKDIPVIEGSYYVGTPGTWMDKEARKAILSLTGNKYASYRLPMKPDLKPEVNQELSRYTPWPWPDSPIFIKKPE